MQVSVTFRQMEATNAIRDYAVEKVKRVTEKYFQVGEAEAHVVLSTERYWHIANLTATCQGVTATVEERSEDMYSSIDLALDKLERQLAKHKDKLRDHKPTEGAPSL
jgi:putative sigma-54 modulation protein